MACESKAKVLFGSLPPASTALSRKAASSSLPAGFDGALQAGMCPRCRIWTKRSEAAAQAVAGGAEARDRGGDVHAGRVGIDGRTAVRRQREPGLQLASPLWRDEQSVAATVICSRARAGDDHGGASSRRRISSQARRFRDDRDRGLRRLSHSRRIELRWPRAHGRPSSA